MRYYSGFLFCLLAGTITACSGSETSTAVPELAEKSPAAVETALEETSEKLQPPFISALPDTSSGAVSPLDRCGIDFDFQEIEAYQEKLATSEALIETLEKSTVVIAWAGEQQIKAITGAVDVGNVAGKKYCTGSMLNASQVLTAAHCFEPSGPGHVETNPITPRLVAGSSNKADYVQRDLIARAMYVQLDYQEKVIGGRTVEYDDGPSFMITNLDEIRLGDLDYAIITIDNPEAPLAHPVRIGRDDFVINDKAIIIQHPAGQTKKVDVGYITDIQGIAAMYNNIDTRGGSSGAGVLDKDGILRAVHVSGGCVYGGSNWAIRIEEIAQYSPIIRSLAQ